MNVEDLDRYIVRSYVDQYYGNFPYTIIDVNIFLEDIYIMFNLNNNQNTIISTKFPRSEYEQEVYKLKCKERIKKLKRILK